MPLVFERRVVGQCTGRRRMTVGSTVARTPTIGGCRHRHRKRFELRSGSPPGMSPYQYHQEDPTAVMSRNNSSQTNPIPILRRCPTCRTGPIGSAPCPQPSYFQTQSALFRTSTRRGECPTNLRHRSGLDRGSISMTMPPWLNETVSNRPMTTAFAISSAAPAMRPSP